MSPSDTRRAMAAVIACISAAGMAIGMILPLLALTMEKWDTPATIIGLNTAMPALASLLLCPLIPRLMRHIPVIPFLFGCIALAVLCIPSYYLIPDVSIWFLIRFLNGLAITGLFVISETWLNQIVDDDKRGRSIGLYVTVLSAGFAAGPFILLLTGTSGFAPYAAISVIIALASVPLIPARHLAPAADAAAPPKLSLFFAAAPTAMIAAFTYGAIESESLSLLAVYAYRSGLSEAISALTLSVFAAGNIVCQIPIGMLADRMDRRLLLIVCTTTALLCTASLPFTVHLPIFFPILFLFGGVICGLYTVGLTLIGQRFASANLASANAAFIFLYSSGSLAGPTLGGIAMQIWDPHGLAFSMAAIAALYLAIAGYRYAFKPLDSRPPPG